MQPQLKPKMWEKKQCELHCESKKQSTAILSITWPNTDRFQNLFTADSLVNVQ